LALQRWQLIEGLYHAARESGEAVLAGVDTEIRQEVERLLAQDRETGDKLLDQRAADLIQDLAEVKAAIGSRLGPYKIEALLGRGGMGQVFRATDTRLGRPVAIKISNQEFIGRFEHESRAIAALNHPNICTLHDAGPNYLVMELVEGETLAARLKRGKLSTDQAVRFGIQIAEALAAAHAKGIIHRDLKPANIMLTKSGLKVLDFGLAKSVADPAVTGVSAVAGTPAYMAPEQREGKRSDARTDIYALGMILREMVTGRRSEGGAVPPPLDRIVRRCLEDDPDERWQCARDLKWELQSAGSVPVAATSRTPNRLFAGALAAVTLLLAALAVMHFREEASRRETVRTDVLLPSDSRVLSLALSPDGRTIAMALVRQGKQQIWVRSLDALEPTPLTGTDNAANPFWSPDSRFIAFFANDRLKKIDRSGGPVQTLCDAHAAVGGTWNRKGDILLGGLFRVLRVADTGGPVTDLPGPQAYWPVFLPDGGHYLATRDAIWLRSMKGPEARRIVLDVSNTEVMERLPGRNTGGVLFTRAGTLMALPFDMKRLEPAGEAFTVARGIAGTNSGWLAATSSEGDLAYVSGQEGADLKHQIGQWHYVWRDRQGAYLGALGEAGGVVMISPNGRQLAGDPNSEISVLDLASGVTTQLTFPPSWAQNPAWSSDGRYVAYNKAGGIFQRSASGAGPEELLVKSDALAVPKSYSPDGQFLLYCQVSADKGSYLLATPLHGDGKPLVVAQTEGTGQFSPDGHWVSYTSNESGLSEIYVVPFPPSSRGGKWLVSRGGGVQARWAHTGKELFYIAPDNTMMEVNVDTRPTFHAGTPRPLFQTEMVDTGIRSGPNSWDLAPDGKRFLIITPKSPYTASVRLVLNWWAGQEK